MKEKRANSISEVDMRGLKMPFIAVYDHPVDFPDHCVARIFDINRPTDTIIVKNSLADIQKDIRENTAMLFMLRGAEDVKSLVGVWV